MAGRKLTTSEFIKRSKKIHGRKYDYSKTQYGKNNNIEVCIICKKHGPFLQIPRRHLEGRGCKKCGYDIVSTALSYTTKEFISKARKIHKNKYNYSKTKYKKYGNKVIVICKKHGEFMQTPLMHLKGAGCRKCALEYVGSLKKSTTEEFIKKANVVHKNKFDYSKTKYEKSNKKVIIICKKHGEFLKTPNDHLGGGNCPRCHNESFMLTIDQFVSMSNDVHDNRYDYSRVRYINNGKKVTIICKKHGKFKQTPYAHAKQGEGCPFCSKKWEYDVYRLLKKHFKMWKILKHYKLWDCYKRYKSRRFCDFLLEKDGVKIVVEYDGHQHFYPVRFNGISLYKAKKLFKIQKKIDKLDKKFCEENNIILYRIKYNKNREKSVIKLKDQIGGILLRGSL